MSFLQKVKLHLTTLKLEFIIASAVIEKESKTAFKPSDTEKGQGK